MKFNTTAIVNGVIYLNIFALILYLGGFLVGLLCVLSSFIMVFWYNSLLSDSSITGSEKE